MKRVWVYVCVNENIFLHNRDLLSACSTAANQSKAVFLKKIFS